LSFKPSAACSHPLELTACTAGSDGAAVGIAIAIANPLTIKTALLANVLLRITVLVVLFAKKTFAQNGKVRTFGLTTMTLTYLFQQ
jgi:hypothetical protein